MTMKGERRRDNQQWMLDWMVKTTGRVQGFALDARMFPQEVKSYRMIPRVLEKRARRIEAMGKAAEAAGHVETAAELFWRATEHYLDAQHCIFLDDNPEKQYLHSKVLECFEHIMLHADHPIERVEIPFEGNYIQAVLHLTASRKSVPTVLFCPGMDMTKESFINPLEHPFVARGMNCLHIDGPGQGTSNIRKIRVTLDNYERAGKAALDYLASRPEVDAGQLAVAGFSMGSYWGMRIAAIDPRVKAVATAAACYGSKRPLFEEASPRFKQIYMYMAGVHDEDEFDRIFGQMTLDDVVSQIRCPCLMVTGEYDPLAHLEDVVGVYEQMTCPKELWIIENHFHNNRYSENLGGIDFFGYLADWLRDAFDGKKPNDLKREVLVGQKDGLGTYDKEMAGFFLPERLGIRDFRLTPAQFGPKGIE